MTDIYMPTVGEILHLTDGTPVRVAHVYSNHFGAERVDGEYFTDVQAYGGYRTAAWRFTGERGTDDPNWESEGMNILFPNSKALLEQQVTKLGGTITWTDPDLIRAREIWAKHARPNGGWQYNQILEGEADDGAAMKAILEAIKSN